MRNHAAYALSLVWQGVPVDWVAKDLRLSEPVVLSMISDQSQKIAEMARARRAAIGPEDVYNETESFRDRWL